MKKEKRWRYFCDYCKKSSSSGGHMKKHENGCTNNPKRACWMCEIFEQPQQPMNQLTAVLNDGGDLNDLLKATNDCSMCTLSAIRQSSLENEDKWHLGFDYKAHSKSVLQRHNDSL